MGVPLDVNSIQPCDVLFFTHEHFTDVLKKSLSVTRHNVDIDRVNGLSLIAPADFDHAFLIVSNKVLDIGTVDAMNRDTTPARDKSAGWQHFANCVIKLSMPTTSTLDL